MNRKIEELVKLSLSLHHLNKSIETEFGLSMIQYYLLSIIKDHPASAPQSIAKTAGIHPSTLTISMRRLQNRGYLYVAEDPRDSRKKIVSLTSKGRNALLKFESELFLL